MVAPLPDMKPFVTTPSFMRRVDAATSWVASVYASPLWWRLAIAALAVAIGTSARVALASRFEGHFTFATLYPAVEIAAVLGGFYPGLFATFSGAFVTHLWFRPVETAAYPFGLSLFIASCTVLSIITEILHRTRLRLNESQEKREIAERLNIATRHLQIAISAGAIGTWLLDLGKNAAIVNDEFRSIFGLAPDVDVNPDVVFRTILPNDVSRPREALRAALEPSGNGLYHAEYRIRRVTDGAIRWVSSRGQTAFENGKPVRVVGVARDVTDEKVAARAHQERAQLAEQLESVAATTPGVVFSFYLGDDSHIAYRYVSPKAKAVFGVAAEDICADARVFYRRVHVADHDHLNAALVESAHSLSHWDVEFRFEHPEKGAIWLEAQAAPVCEQDGKLVWHGYVSDVTERKRSEIALAETAARLQAMIDGAQDAVITMDSDGRIQSVNRAALSMFGHDAGELAACNITALLSDVATRPETKEANDLRALEAGIGHRWEVEARRRNGKVFPAEFSLSEARYDHRRILIGFVKDLSEQRKVQQRVEKLNRDRLDAMAGMAGKLAHEINQPLAATATYLKVARRLLERPPQEAGTNIVELIDKATIQTLRAGKIVNSLRQLVARGEPDKTLVSVHELILNTYDSMLADGANTDAQIRLERNASRDDVVADRAQLQQVLVILMRNAIEAMQETEKQELIVSTSNPDDRTIRVDVTDTGGGLAGNVEEDFFEPFATTKEKGMGVGLSISRSIIEAHYGRIWAKPNPRGGAVFSFTLPLQNAEEET